jgi:hypothetical protein
MGTASTRHRYYLVTFTCLTQVSTWISRKVQESRGKVLKTDKQKQKRKKKGHLAFKQTVAIFKTFGLLNIFCFHAKNLAFSSFFSRKVGKGHVWIYICLRT